ncbi:hypothetical protein GJU39_17275 [Pedobacter petrophilus]|uniref:Uncharacterized protein n=1 Tax=Pedobacter petrophilus TaxID=1908241 RepID=A0A7K0G1Y0_9SPHI|nr:hypothetical protein [Pedobacter petrophilus]
MSTSFNGKPLTVPLNSVSTSLSRYYDEPVPGTTNVKAKDSTATKTEPVVSSYKAGIFYLTIDAKSLPDDLLKLVAGKKNTFDGTITIADSYGKLPTRTIKFFKAYLYSFSDQYSSTYYSDSIGNAVISLSCNALSINGVLIEQ